MHQGAYRNIGIHIAVEADIADGAAIDSPAKCLQFFDDLHGAEFWRAGYGTAGESPAQQIERVLPGRQPAGNCADQVMYGSKTFQGK